MWGGWGTFIPRIWGLVSLFQTCDYAPPSTAKQKFTLQATGDTPQEITSPGFPNSTYPSNTIILWQLRAARGNVIKLKFDTFMLDDDCSNDFVRVYDSLVEDESCLLAE